MSTIRLSIVCCEATGSRFSRMVETTWDWDDLTGRVVRTVEQQLGAGEARPLHNAAHDADHGPVTYLQEVHAGGFSVFVGPPDALQETFFGAGTYVAFMDDQGPGHASKVGPEGVRRTMRVLKGHLPLP